MLEGLKITHETLQAVNLDDANLVCERDNSYYGYWDDFGTPLLPLNNIGLRSSCLSLKPIEDPVFDYVVFRDYRFVFEFDFSLWNWCTRVYGVDLCMFWGYASWDLGEDRLDETIRNYLKGLQAEEYELDEEPDFNR